MFDLSLVGGQGNHWSTCSLAFTVGHSYDIVLWEINYALSTSPTWRLHVGYYKHGNEYWVTVLDSAQLKSPGDFLRFTPALTDTFDFGWREYVGSRARFLIFDVYPAGQ